MVAGDQRAQVSWSCWSLEVVPRKHSGHWHQRQECGVNGLRLSHAANGESSQSPKKIAARLWLRQSLWGAVFGWVSFDCERMCSVAL